ncbi:MAG: tetratricopeptide repeat protein [Terracidiphilus sp.]|nr:tetratricopeptide repeat protein [Terracidiphilus sp.]
MQHTRTPSPAPQHGSARQAPVSILDGMLGTALKHHRQGRLAEAERIYRRILALDARHAGSLHLLGTLAHQVGRHDVAVQLIRAAIAIDPSQAAYHSNLGAILQAQGQLDEAAAACQQALERDPSLAEAHMNLGTVLQAQGNAGQAAQSFRKALAVRPDLAEAYMNLGNILQAQGKLSDAVASHERALALKPDYAEAYYNLGNARHAQAQLDQAAACFERALALKPNLPEAHYNLGNTRQAQDDLAAAAACFERALAHRPEYAEAHYNLACVLQQQGRLIEALPHFQRAVDLKPDYSQARFGQALAQIQSSDFAQGWRNYESRWQSIDHETPMRAYPQPLWQGEPLGAGRLLLWGEQGVGDEIMFAGLVPDAIRTGNRIVLDCDPRLMPLFARSFPSVEVVASAAHLAPGSAQRSGPEKPVDPASPAPTIGAPDAIAAHLPTGSLPGLLRACGAPYAADPSPYLRADPMERDRFRARYADGRRLIGLAWQTRNQKTGRKRSIDLAAFAPLFALPGLRWISLQYGDFDQLEQQALTAHAPLAVDRGVDQFADIDRFAAQVAAMDLVLTIDNSTAHLSGALGVPVWLMLPFAANWRWLLNREDSPWYASMRLFRQPAPGNWDAPIHAVCCALPATFK